MYILNCVVFLLTIFMISDCFSFFFVFFLHHLNRIKFLVSVFVIYFFYYYYIPVDESWTQSEENHPKISSIFFEFSYRNGCNH